VCVCVCVCLCLCVCVCVCVCAESRGGVSKAALERLSSRSKSVGRVPFVGTMSREATVCAHCLGCTRNGAQQCLAQQCLGTVQEVTEV
jgi:predicted transcriptional regulator